MGEDNLFGPYIKNLNFIYDTPTQNNTVLELKMASKMKDRRFYA